MHSVSSYKHLLPLICMHLHLQSFKYSDLVVTGKLLKINREKKFRKNRVLGNRFLWLLLFVCFFFLLLYSNNKGKMHTSSNKKSRKGMPNKQIYSCTSSSRPASIFNRLYVVNETSLYVLIIGCASLNKLFLINFLHF